MSFAMWILLKRYALNALVTVWLGAVALPAMALEPAATEEDARLQGEYYGPSNYQMFLGLQVRALGEGRFEARLYEGGLPGNGWYGDAPVYELVGERDGPLLTLRGGDWIVAIRYPYATVYHRGGSYAGGLTKVVRSSPTFGLKAPAGAIVLFDPEVPSLRRLVHAKLTRDGFLSRGAETADRFQDFRLHVEFRTPWMPKSRGQARGNSGIYLQRRYEVQILDSFAEPPVFNGAGAIYRTRPPAINMAFPPGQWQTYDIEFTAARFDPSGGKVLPATVTVWHNGVLIHDHFPLPNKTGAGRPEGPEPGPVLFQDHRDEVEFRYIWIQPLPALAPSGFRPRVACGAGTAMSRHEAGASETSRIGVAKGVIGDAVHRW